MRIQEISGHRTAQKIAGAAVALAFAAVTFSPLAGADEMAASKPSDSKWRVRARVIGVIPDDDSTNINVETPAGGRIPLNAGVKVDSAVVPEFDLTYMITPNIGIEAIAGMTNHDIKIDGTDATLAGLGAVDGFKIFDAWVLPPTVTLQYHFKPDAKFRPYVGFGVNYTAFLWNDATDNLERAVGGPVDVDTSSSWGWAGQFGFDYELSNNWFANFDVKYIDMDTIASLNMPTLLGGVGLRVKADINPWVVGAGIGYRF
ncbi:MAG: OmpW family protein [Gammaproteobacteria bacterium]